MNQIYHQFDQGNCTKTSRILFCCVFVFPGVLLNTDQTESHRQRFLSWNYGFWNRICFNITTYKKNQYYKDKKIPSESLVDHFSLLCFFYRTDRVFYIASTCLHMCQEYSLLFTNTQYIHHSFCFEKLLKIYRSSRGVLQKSCSENFCKIHKKTPAKVVENIVNPLKSHTYSKNFRMMKQLVTKHVRVHENITTILLDFVR